MNTPTAQKQPEEKKTLIPPKFSDLRAGTLIPIGICLAVIAWLYAPIFKWWWGNWMRDESYYEHAVLVPFITIGLIWLKRKELSKLELQAFAKGFLVLIPILIAVILASWAGPSSPLGLTFPVVIAGLVFVLFGPVVLRHLAFPIGYLYFMCVLPGFILVASSFRIQILSTIGASYMLKMAGLEPIRDGTIINLPNIQVLVGAPCSGFRLLISMLALAVLFIYITQGKKWAKGLLLVSIVPISIALNSFRIALTALVGQYRGAEAMHSFHDWAGYIMLALAIVILWLLGRLFRCGGFNSTLSY